MKRLEPPFLPPALIGRVYPQPAKWLPFAQLLKHDHAQFFARMFSRRTGQVAWTFFRRARWDNPDGPIHVICPQCGRRAQLHKYTHGPARYYCIPKDTRNARERNRDRPHVSDREPQSKKDGCGKRFTDLHELETVFTPLVPMTAVFLVLCWGKQVAPYCPLSKDVLRVVDRLAAARTPQRRRLAHNLRHVAQYFIGRMLQRHLATHATSAVRKAGQAAAQRERQFLRERAAWREGEIARLTDHYRQAMVALRQTP